MVRECPWPGTLVLQVIVSLDWYDGEHAPARLKVPGILSAARYKVTDSTRPSWIAVYDLASPDVLQSDAYQALRSNASSNEHSIISRVSTLHRTVYRLFASLPKQSVYSATPAANCLLIASIEPENAEIEEEMNKWYAEEHLDMLSKVPGFIRARRFKLVTHGEAASKAGGDSFKPSKYISYIEWDSNTFMESKEWIDASLTPWSVKIIPTLNAQLRVYALHKSF